MGRKKNKLSQVYNKDLGHVKNRLEPGEIADGLPRSTLVTDDHDLASEGDKMQ